MYVYICFKGMDTLYYHGMSSHPSTIVKKAQQMGINHDIEVLRWKQSSQEYHNRLSCFKNLKRLPRRSGIYSRSVNSD